MTRKKINRRVTMTGEFVCCAPLHVGGLDSPSGADLTLSINGAGQFYIPGTSLTGPLRAWCHDMWDDDATNDLWGFQEPRNSANGWASFVIVEDAVFPDGTVSPEIRDGVGIDRDRGTAAAGVKFNREILPAGTRLPFTMVFDEEPTDQTGKKMLASLIQALESGEIRFGAAKSRGLGKVVLENFQAVEHQIGSREGILRLLRGDGGRSGQHEVLCKDWKEHARVRPWIKIHVKWRPLGPLMVKSSADGMIIDTLPLLSSCNGDHRLVLPGSSSKGALRSQAERIVTTLLRPPTCPGKFLEQLSRHAIIETLFGARNAKESDNEPSNEDEHQDQPLEPLPGLSALSIEDCHSEVSISAGTWRHMLFDAIETGSEEQDPKHELTEWARSLHEYRKNGAGAPYLDPAMRVAIDRWTGSVSGSALFSVLEPWNIEWQKLTLTVDPCRLARSAKDRGTDQQTVALAAFTLLLLTLDDFTRGEVPLGFGVNRGFGSVEVESISIECPEAEQSYYSAPSRNFLRAVRDLRIEVGQDEKLTFSGDAVQNLQKAWAAYLDAKGAASAHEMEAAPA